MSVKRNEGIKVTFAGECAVKTEQQQIKNKCCDKSPDIENIRHNKQKNTAEFKTVTKFIVWLSVICHGNKSHIKN